MIRSHRACLPVILAFPLFLAGCYGTSVSTVPPAVLSPSVTTLAATPNPATPGAKITMVATVSSTSPVVGVVSFFDGTTLLGTATASNSMATFAISTFTAANTTHQLSASYAGDAIHAASGSSMVPVTIGGATAPTAISAHASFSFATPNQTISGFGAAEAFDLTYLDQHPYSAEMYRALFDPTAGLGLTYLRLQNLYRAGVTNFDADTPAILTAANAAHGSPLTVLLSSWSPPANIKSNGTTNGCSGITNGACTSGTGTLIQVGGAYDYADFATYWYNSLAAYATLGVIPAYISIQNEPDFTPTYAGCRFNPTEATYNGTNYAGYGLAFNAVYNKIQGLASVPAMVGPEAFGLVQDFFDISAQIPANEVAAYAHHLYNVNSGSASSAGVITPGGSPDNSITPLSNLNATYPKAKKFATEYFDTPGFYDAWTIHNALVYGNDSAYIYWQAVWPSQLTTAKDQSADQQGLLYADNPGAATSTWAFPHGWTYNDSYYSLKHFSYFVRPGYVRYNAVIDNADERISVYQSPDTKTTVIVVLNVSTSATDGLSLDLSAINYTASTIYRSSFSQPILGGERWANLGSYIAPTGVGSANNSGGINMLPQSALTIVLTR